MKKVIVALLAACLAIVPAFAMAAGALKVQGSATVTVAPDKAIVSVGYSGEQTDSAVAQKQAADVVAAVVAAVTALGIEEDKITTSYLNMYPTYNYLENASQLRGYMVEHVLAITVSDITQVGTVLDTALKAGANQTNGITYASSREKEIYLQALALAVENAVSKADALAIASGVWLGGLSEINEVSSASFSPYARYGAAEMAADASLGDSLRTGDLKIEAMVELIYETR